MYVILCTMTQGPGGERLAAEQRARVLIDRQLVDAGWSVQDKKDLNLFASQGVACREVVMKQGHGRADYLLYVDQKVVGVIEAKPAGASLSGVEWQSAMYAAGLPAAVRLRALTVEGRLPFVFEASGTVAGGTRIVGSERCSRPAGVSACARWLSPLKARLRNAA